MHAPPALWRRRQLPALAALALAARPLPSWALGESPDDQLLIGMSMNNLLSLDPAAATGLDATTVACNLYDSLLELDAGQPTRLLPALAEHWAVTDGGRRIRLRLREGLRFASGRPLLADDAAWSLQRVLKLNLAPASVWKSYGFSAANVEPAIRAPDPHSLVLQLPQATDPLLPLYTLATSMSGYVLDREAVLAQQTGNDLGNTWLNNHAAGSGAFVLEGWRPKELLTLRRAEHHWRAPAKLRRVVMRHMTESQTLRLMLMRADLDIAGGLSAPDLRALARRPGLVVESLRRGTVYYVALNAREPAFADERVRRAVLRHLIDFQGLAHSVLPFQGELHLRPVPAGLPASLAQPAYKPDLQAARALLADAGLAKGFDTTIRVVAEAPFTAIATSLQASLAQAGIRASILPGTGNQVYGSMRERKFQIVVGRGGGGAEPHPHASLRALVYNPDNRDAARLTNFQGWRTGYADPVLNGLIESALLAPDVAAQTALYQQAQQRFDHTVGAIQPLAQVVETQVLRSVVQGYVGHPAGTTRLREVFKAART